MKTAYIVEGKRTPIGSLLGNFKDVSGVDLAAVCVKALIESTKISPDGIDEVVMGNVLSTGLGQNPARQVALKAGVGLSVPCFNINKVCASGLKAVTIGATDIKAGNCDVVMAGGFESMTNAPHYMKTTRRGHKFGDFAVFDTVTNDGLTDAYSRKAMGYCAEKTAKQFNITRELQDEYCISSYERSLLSIEKGHFLREIVPVNIQGPSQILMDEEPPKFKRAKIPKLNPVFPDEAKQGTVTGANASKINDGACALLLMSHEALMKYNIKPKLEIISFVDAETSPEDFNLSPVISARKALDKACLEPKHIDFWEVNEAFSVTPLVLMQQLNLDRNKVNVHGGAVSLGHPIGMSGARILLSLMNVLDMYKGKYGCAVICNGGGGSTAIVVKYIF